MNIVFAIPDRDHYLTPMIPFLDYPVVFLRNYDWEDLIKLEPVAVIFLSDWILEQFDLIDKCKANKIPTILLMDGLIEWRHFFENPKWSRFKNESPYLPINCDKIFVAGASTSRFLSFLGNNGKCEITGLPRMDVHQLKKPRQKKVNNEVFKIGVLSGNTPGYLEQHISETKQMFLDIYNWGNLSTEVKLRWRIRKGFEKQLDFQISNNPEESLEDFFNDVDAIITQPSTIAYEAMIYGLPVIIADYGNSPNYMSSAWKINSKEHLQIVFEEVKRGEKLKFMYQYNLLQDNLAFIQNSSYVSGNLINDIIKFSKSKTFNGHFPPNMIMDLSKRIKILKFEPLTEPLFGHRLIYEFSDEAKLQEEVVKLRVKILKLESYRKGLISRFLSIIYSKFKIGN